MKRNAMIADVLNLLLAAWLFLSPWIVGFAHIMPAAWVAWLSAIAIAVVAIAALAAFAEWEEWINLILGVWLLLSPWIARFSTHQHPMLVLFLTGAAVAIISAIELWLLHRQPPPVTA